MPVAKTLTIGLPTVKSYAILDESGRIVKSALVPAPEVIKAIQPASAPGGPGVTRAPEIAPLPEPGLFSQVGNFISGNPLLILGGALVIGFLLRRK